VPPPTHGLVLNARLILLATVGLWRMKRWAMPPFTALRYFKRMD